MDEQQARARIEQEHGVSRETMVKLDQFALLLRTANATQNLVAEASLDQLWQRHLRDSAQLLKFAPSPDATWVDLGSGAGFPGLIVALLHSGPVTLIEERRLRVDFLREVARQLEIDIEIVASKAERVGRRRFDVISARAFAPLDRLLDVGARFSTTKTVWILPKGRNAQSELDALDSSWQGDFRLEQSLTDAEARIIIAQGVHRTDKRMSR